MKQTVCLCAGVCVCVCVSYILSTKTFYWQSEGMFAKWGHFGWSPQFQSTVCGFIPGFKVDIKIKLRLGLGLGEELGFSWDG